MQFNSWDFWVFFPTVYFLYLLVPKLRFQNLLLLAASYYFYAAWDWKFLSLIIFSTVVDYWCGRGIESAPSHRRKRLLLIVSMVVNLGLLGIFKYYGFFLGGLETLLEPLLTSLGMAPDSLRLDVVLPVGISFYTFQTMSYTIDIYRGQMRPTRDFLNFALFVAFFPQLVAGPIERAKHLLPQVEKPRSLTQDGLTTGAWLIFWGLFKKIVIADNLSPIADQVYADSAQATSAMAYLATVAFAFQIYCDFSAYSDIARGLARMMGFDLMRNFNLPYFATSPSDFWQRWHISLSTWLRDYLYIPLGGNRGGKWATNRNLAITMLLGGLWHGASWNYVWWGAFHGLILIIYNRREWPAATAWRRVVSQIFMFHLTLVGWLLFRSTRRVDGADDSYRQITEMLGSFANGWGLNQGSLILAGDILFFTFPLLLMQCFQYRTGDHYFLLRRSFPVRVTCYAALVLIWLLYGRQTGSEFIYFQF